MEFQSAFIAPFQGQFHSSSSKRNVCTRAFQIPTLPYGYAALEPHIDAITMHVHHTKHHNAYVTKLNNALKESEEKYKNLSLGDLHSQLPSLPKPLQKAVVENAGGSYNHALYWAVMAPPGCSTRSPSGALKEKILSTWGSVDKFKQEFDAAALAHFGSGFVWLIVKDGELSITSLPNQNNPLMKGVVTEKDFGIPIFCLDVWEHAYYLRYQNRRPEYIKAFWSIVNWDKVSTNYDMAMDGKIPSIHDCGLVESCADGDCCRYTK